MKRHILFKLVLSAALLMALLPALVMAGPPAEQATIHPLVLETLQVEGEADILVVLPEQADLSGADALPTKEAKGRYVYEALWSVAEDTQKGLRAVLNARQADYQTFYIVNAIRVRADSALVHSLAARPDVTRIVPNPWVKGIPSISSPDPSAALRAGLLEARLGTSLPEPAHGAERHAPQDIEGNITRVNADDVWAMGYTGQGVVVAGQDTGYDWEHPALKDHYRGWDGTTANHDYNWHDAIHSGGGICGPDAPEPCDDHSHGTHTMGTLVGDDGGSNRIGMAPGAKWIGCRNMDEGYGTPATYMECFEFFLAPYPLVGDPFLDGDPALAPHVVSNSWSCPPSEGCDAESLEASVEALRQAGIVVVVSAGNYGPGCSSVDYPPAIYQQSLTVGGFNHRDDVVSSFSSRGPVTYDGHTYTKPDISAPAVSVRSCVPGTGYGYKSGTSMAAPHVAGAVALLLSAAPGFAGDANTIEDVLTRTAEPKTTAEGCGGDGPADVPNNVWGWGILDAHAAVVSGLVRGTVTDFEYGAPVAGANLTAVPALLSGVGTEVRTDSFGSYAMALPAGSYTVTVDTSGYIPQMITNVVVISGEVTIQDFALVAAVPYYLPLVVKDS